MLDADVKVRADLCRGVEAFVGLVSSIDHCSRSHDLIGLDLENNHEKKKKKKGIEVCLAHFTQSSISKMDIDLKLINGFFSFFCSFKKH
jgi:hypothetical protein